MSDEKRGGERVTINKEFESFDAFIQEYVTNISESGVFIKSTSPLAVGTLVNLRFTVIMDDIETIEGVGEVVRVVRDDGAGGQGTGQGGGPGVGPGVGMGVVFRELSGYSKDLIQKLLTQRAR